MSTIKAGPPSPEDQRYEDLRKLMAEPWGRRLAYWLVYEVGGLELEAFDLQIKDGICAALHQARVDGMRRVARTLAAHMRRADLDGFLLTSGDGQRIARREKPDTDK